MSALNLQVRYRPIKIGWCIRENNFEDYKKALKLTHTLWGGFANPLIVVGENVSAVQLVNLYKVDLLYPITDDATLLQFIDQFPHLAWPRFSPNDLFPMHGNFRFPLFLDMIQAAHRFSSDLKKELIHQENIYFIDWAEDDPLSNVFEAMFGSYPNCQALDLDFDYNKAMPFLLSENIKKISLKQDEAIFSSFMPMTINRLTQHALVSTGESFYRSPKPGFYIGDVKDFNDLVTFWNIKAGGIPAIFYDKNHHLRFSELKNVYMEKILSQTVRTYDTSSMDLWSKNTSDISFLQETFGEKINIKNFYDKYDIYQWRFREYAPTIGILSNGSVRTVSFQLPTKPTVDTRPRMAQLLIVSINVDDNHLNESYDFRFPFLPLLNQFFIKNVYNSKGVRAEPGGLDIIISENDSNLKITAIEIEKLIQEIFRNIGIRTELSDAGRKALNLINLMKSLENCKIFKILGLRRLVETYKPNDSFARSHATRIISQLDESTKKSNFEKYKNLFLKEDGIEITPTYVFEWLAEKEIFRAGLKLKCHHCQSVFWRIIDDIKSRSICEYCGEDFEILSQLKDKDWSYRLSGILGDDNHQAGAIPVVLTLQHLAKNFFRNVFMFTTSINLIPISSKIDKCESDFIVITRDEKGKVSIVISECKNHTEITEEDVIKLKKVADELQNDYIDVYILFAKLDSFSDKEIKRCLQAQDAYKDRIILLTNRELETDLVYDNTQEAKGFFQMHGVSWETLANFTKLTYFKDIN